VLEIIGKGGGGGGGGGGGSEGREVVTEELFKLQKAPPVACGRAIESGEGGESELKI
jgi:hypothetical protein